MKLNLDIHMSYFHNNELLQPTTKRTETVDEYLARGGKITQLPDAKSDPNGTSVQAIREAIRIYERRIETSFHEALTNKKS